MAQQKQTGLPQKTRLPLMGAYSNRGSSPTKDQRFVNMFPETRKVDQLENTKIFINKRPGLLTYKNFGAGEGRGLAYFRGKFWIIIGNQLILDGSPSVVKATLGTSTGHVGMIQCNSATLGDYLFICDGISAWIVKQDETVETVSSTSLYSVTIVTAGSGYTNGTYALSFTGGGGSGAAGTYTVTGNTVTSISISNRGTGYTSAPSVGFPSGGGTGATATAILNAFPTPHVSVPTFIDGYVAVAKGSDVYTCDLDNPLLWNGSNYLSAEMFPDEIKALARQNNQVVVLGHSSIEFFYDAANAAGSPLSRNDAATIQMGTATPYAIYQNEQFCIYVSASESGGRAAWIIKGFQPSKISDEYIERILDAEEDMSDCYGFGIRTKGHLFYIINLKTSGRTLVYDVDEKLWHEWSTNTDGSHTVFAYNFMADSGIGAAHILHTSTGDVSKVDPNAYVDNAVSILCDVVTNKYDMDSYNRKFMHSLKLVGDSYSPNNLISFYWTDDDYQTWSNEKTINMNDDFPAFQRLGAFRRRAFRFYHTNNMPLRLESVEVVYTEGAT